MASSDEKLSQSIKNLVEQQKTAHKFLASFYKQIVSIFDALARKNDFKYYYWSPSYKDGEKIFKDLGRIQDNFWMSLPLYWGHLVYTKEFTGGQAGIFFKLNCDEGFREVNGGNAAVNPLDLKSGESTVEVFLYKVKGAKDRKDWYDIYVARKEPQPDVKDRTPGKNEIKDWFPNPKFEEMEIWCLCFSLAEFLEAQCSSDDKENKVLVKIKEMCNLADVEHKKILP